MLCRVALWESLDISSPLIGCHEVAKETGSKFVLQQQSHSAIHHKTYPVSQKARAALIKMADMSSGHYIGESLFTLFASLTYANHYLMKLIK